MKQPKTFLFLSILVAVLVLGIAYAAITANFTITSSATVAPDGSNFKVAFTASEATSVSNKDASLESVKTAILADTTKATLTIESGVLKAKGDTAIATFTVSNESVDLKAILDKLIVTPIVTEDDPENKNQQYVKFTAEFGANGSTIDPVDDTTIDTTTIIVKAELIKNPVEEVKATATVTFEATAEEI